MMMALRVYVPVITSKPLCAYGMQVEIDKIGYEARGGGCDFQPRLTCGGSYDLSSQPRDWYCRAGLPDRRFDSVRFAAMKVFSGSHLSRPAGVELCASWGRACQIAHQFSFWSKSIGCQLWQM